MIVTDFQPTALTAAEMYPGRYLAGCQSCAGTGCDDCYIDSILSHGRNVEQLPVVHPTPGAMSVVEIPRGVCLRWTPESGDGYVIVAVHSHRQQLDNLRAARRRLAEIVRGWA
jgi:sugar lactone lactonase YvrE